MRVRLAGPKEGPRGRKKNDFERSSGCRRLLALERPGSAEPNILRSFWRPDGPRSKFAELLVRAQQEIEVFGAQTTKRPVSRDQGVKRSRPCWRPGGSSCVPDRLVVGVRYTFFRFPQTVDLGGAKANLTIGK